MKLESKEKYLDFLFEGRKFPKPWMVHASYLRMAADILYKKYEDAIKYFKENGCGFEYGKNLGSFPHEIFQKNFEIITEHQTNLDLMKPYLLLQGFAIELAIKSVLISLDHNYAGKVKKDGHKLVKLFEKSNITLDNVQLNLLDRLTDCIVWAGRYPYPLARNELQYKPLPNDKFSLPGYCLENDSEVIESIWHLLMQEWNAYCSKLDNNMSPI